MIYELHARYDELPEPRRFYVGMALIGPPIVIGMLGHFVGLVILLALLFSRIWYLNR